MTLAVHRPRRPRNPQRREAIGWCLRVAGGVIFFLAGAVALAQLAAWGIVHP